MYFISVLLNKVKELRYKPHYYGPYSAIVNEANEDLKSLGFIEETVFSDGSMNNQGFEIARHDFKLTELGEKIAKQKIEKNPSEWEEITSAANQIELGGSINYMKLSVAAKAYHILTENNEKISLDDIKLMAKKLGWSVNDGELQDATDYLEKIKLVVKK